MASKGQRAFATKLNKRGAAEVRKQVSSAYLADLPKSISGLNLTTQQFTQNVPLTEVVEPPDYEDINLQQQRSGDRDFKRECLEYPENDVSVERLRREVRTIAPIVPEHGADADPHVRDCISLYTSDYTVVNRGFEECASQHLEGAEGKDSTLKASLRQEYEVDMDDGPAGAESDRESSSSRRSSALIAETPRGSWASSIFDLKNSPADPILPHILDPMGTEDMDLQNAAHRQHHRQHQLFSLYQPQLPEEIIEKRQKSSPPSEHFGQRILVKCLQLRLELEIEPIFASMALYDATEKKKISENFYFDLCPENIKKMLIMHTPYSDLSSLSRACVFSITYPSPDIFIVIKLEKVLQQGDISEVAEPYVSSKDEKGREKARQNAKYYCEKLGKYRMPFAWTAIHLKSVIEGKSNQDFPGESSRSDSLDRRTSSSLVGQYESFRKKNEDKPSGPSFLRHGSLERQRSTDKRTSWIGGPEETTNYSNFRPITLTLSGFFKQEADKLCDEDLYKFLADLKRPSSTVKKLKWIPGQLKLDVSPCPEDLKYCLTPELYKIDPFPDGKERPIKEVVEFPPREVFEPHTTYRNLLYVYPKYVNFANRQGSARNIAVKAQFMNGEEDHHALPVIFGKSSCSEYMRESYTGVTYHNNLMARASASAETLFSKVGKVGTLKLSRSRTPDFHEEIKMKVPAKLTDSHHLLFTFYHVSCQRKAQADTGPLETPIGYTWLPLLRDGCLVKGDYLLPVSVEKPPMSYSMLHPDVQLPGMKWVDNHKGIFSVSIKAVTSLHTLDKKLDKFLSLVNAAEMNKIPVRIGESKFEEELKRSIFELVQAEGEPLVRFLPLIMDKLVGLLVRPPLVAGQTVNVGQAVFEAVADIVKQIEQLVPMKNDQHNRNGLLVQYIQYTCNLPHPDSMITAGSPTSGYATLGRPSSLAFNKPKHNRSNSDPDLPGSGPTSPDAEVAGFIGSKAVDRAGSLRHPELNQYTSWTHSRKLVHDEIALQWVVSSGSTKELAIANSWFFFELMVKSMAEHLARADKLQIPRKARFPERFTDDVSQLVSMLTKDIVDRYSKDFLLMRGLNMSLAYFIQDCFSLMDRGFVFQLMRLYCGAICNKIMSLADSTSLMLLKLEFLRIVCAHEHYVMLNLPLGLGFSPSASSSPSPSIASSTSQTSFTSSCTLMERGLYTDLSTDYRMQHYLVGLVLTELSLTLETHNSTLHSKAINVVRNLLASHDMDERFQDPEVKGRVATLYLPLIAVIMDALPQLHDPNLEARSARNSQSQESMEIQGINQHVAMAIAGSSVMGGGFMSSPPSQSASSYESPTNKSRKSMLSVESTQNLLACFMWIVKTVDNTLLKQWWSEMPENRVNNLLEVFFYAISNFEYKGKKAMQRYSMQTIKKSSDMKSKLEEALLGGLNARSEMMLRRKTSSQFYPGDKGGNLPSPSSEVGKLRWQKDKTQWKQAIESTDVRMRADVEAEAQIEGSLAAEISMITIDSLELIINIVQNTDTYQGVLPYVLRVMLHAMALHQSTVVLENLFATQRALVAKFPELVFEEETEQCADLCLRLLRHCSAPIANTRAHAAISLYLLMRHNFEIGNNFARVKMQVTMSLSSLVGQNQTFNEEHLRKSLKTILTYAESDIELGDTTFPDQVKDLVFNLHMILSDTVKMKEFQEDPEMLLDLMYRIAKGYQNSPDLRLTWLQNMAAKHSELGNHAEAAQCLIHAAGLVAEYLNMLEDRPHLPVGCVALQHVSENVLEESAVSDDVVSPDEEGICSGKYFTETGLVGLLEQAAGSFDMAGMFEIVNEVYKVIIPVHEHNKDFKKLATIHNKLYKAFSDITRQEGRRIFGTYFRVGFYGTKFEDLDGEEFIYKEPAITKLSEISHRLENFYHEKLGPEVLVTIKDSNTVERSNLDPEKAYLQITYVEPYFDLFEMKDRRTFFDRNYNIKRFMYATPFTEDGRAHGELQEQYKRKTILTTSHMFPYVKTRLGVIHREQVILSPIEVAIEDIQKKTKELSIALHQDPPDPKMLQMVLQGCIGTTVNQGPVEVAMVFLAPVIEGVALPSRHHNKLRICFKDFLKKCGDALQKNKTLIGPDQKEYQRELERNYMSVKEKLLPLISSTAVQAKKSRHKKDKDRDGNKRRSNRHSSQHHSHHHHRTSSSNC